MICIWLVVLIYIFFHRNMVFFKNAQGGYLWCVLSPMAWTLVQNEKKKHIYEYHEVNFNGPELDS